MPIRLSVLVVALAAPALSFAARWEKVGETPLASVYVDRDSIRRSGAEVRAALEWRWNDDTEVPDSNATRMYRLERQVQISNCGSRAYAVAEGVRYADLRGTDIVSSYRYDERSLPYSEARPKAIRDTIIAHVCRAVPAGSTAASTPQKP